MSCQAEFVTQLEWLLQKPYIAFEAVNLALKLKFHRGMKTHKMILLSLMIALFPLTSQASECILEHVTTTQVRAAFTLTCDGKVVENEKVDLSDYDQTQKFNEKMRLLLIRLRKEGYEQLTSVYRPGSPIRQTYYYYNTQSDDISGFSSGVSAQ